MIWLYADLFVFLDLLTIGSCPTLYSTPYYLLRSSYRLRYPYFFTVRDFLRILRNQLGIHISTPYPYTNI